MRNLDWRKSIRSKNESAWIIGNGPGLNDINLELLSKKITFGVNKCHLWFDRVSWRPSYFVKSELGDNWREYLYETVQQCGQAFIKATEAIYYLADRIAWPMGHVTPIWTSCQHMSKYYNSPERAEVWHLPRLCCYGGVVMVAIQIAILLGYNPIFLVGCDCSYPEHFSNQYGTDSAIDPNIRNETLRHGHQIAKAECDKLGIAIFGVAARHLRDTYPQVNFEEAIHER